MCVDNKKVPQQPKLKKVINVQYTYTVYGVVYSIQHHILTTQFNTILIYSRQFYVSP